MTFVPILTLMRGACNGSCHAASWTKVHDELHEATGLSHTLIAAGIGRLTELELVQLLGSASLQRAVQPRGSRCPYADRAQSRNRFADVL